MKISEQLKAARELITQPDSWTQNAYARDYLSREVAPSSSDAVCFCALGAIRKANHYTSDLNQPALLLGEVASSVSDWNDAVTHDVVLAGFDEAITLAETKEKLHVYF